VSSDAPRHVVALSGGKDSTALALRLAETAPSVDFTYLCTPTGDELPEMLEHWGRLEDMLGNPIVRVSNGTLDGLIEKWNALPNGRQRWCTRVLKIEPCLAYFAALPVGSVLYVGLRADEEERQGIYSTTIDSRFPLREWGWELAEVTGYLRRRGVSIPARTDCARCYGQRIGEWWDLWKMHPSIYADAEAQETATGHTFRSAQRDTWPAGLADLRTEFSSGRVPPGARSQLSLPVIDDGGGTACRVCRL